MFAILGVALLIVLAIGGSFYNRSRAAAAESQIFETVEIRRGDLTATVSATGTLSAVGTVMVGTQVSGILDKVLADFNDQVGQGDLLAVLDTEALDALVADAEASVSRSEAALIQAEAEVERTKSQVALTQAQQTEAQATYERNQLLFEAGAISQQDFLTRQTGSKTAQATVDSASAVVASAEAGVASAEAAVGSSVARLAQARKNRLNAEIRAPISGLVIERTVDAGQTVAASFSTPTLFVIAEDLAQMEILVQVDESDVGLVKPGQAVGFTVAAYPGQRFAGKVRERRLQPETIQNVVHYTVVVTANNESGLLLPGMTATVDFVVDELKSVLLISSAALQFDPPREIRSAARDEQRRADAENKTQSPAITQATPATPSFSPDVAELWIEDGERKLRPILVQVLSTDGALTAVSPQMSSEGVLKEGLKVVTRMNEINRSPFRK